MRSLVFATVFALSGAAAAQTPADIARQLWPVGGPAVQGAAPVSPGSAGAFGPGDLARLASSAGGSPDRNAAPREATLAGAFTARDLVRLVGGEPPALVPMEGRAYLTARRN